MATGLDGLGRQRHAQSAQPQIVDPLSWRENGRADQLPTLAQLECIHAPLRVGLGHENEGLQVSDLVSIDGFEDLSDRGLG